ncbi:mannose-1-phosphate guanylyltransferase [Adhaeribacter radiodurans]|uniref:mannose-1-phosphate guanylyltransferase n=1 Tax=Adhaeribacter radiodurans TaxID=2745197 RepID=A0A7L7LF06_9BACT|nr:mannose-1-phosphate guanylyltransferase [Adhaeribacter radiodurans]QMU31411.1 mannose-1-phosphate guanylyltransferase [Adhaeribacter radiodurans]
MQSTFVIIMAGGIGTRFWPFSRVNNPKQFHDVLGVGETMLQTTVKRFEKICPPENIFIVTNSDYSGLVKQQIPFLKNEQILCEPIGRNTAPAIAYATYKIKQLNHRANIVVAPADHVILNQEAFVHKIQKALDEATKADILITLGITPSRPDTNYGYIQYIEEGNELKKVKTFTEKPNLEIAKVFLDSGDFVWNAGIFIWNVQTIMRAFHEFLPEITEIFDEGISVFNTEEESTFINRAYSHCRNISIDYGIMEKAGNVYMLPSNFGWSDLGTWNSLYAIGDKDPQGNVIDGEVMLYDTTNCIVKTPQERLVVIDGLHDFIIAEYDNVLMICPKKDEQRVKDFLADAKNKKGLNFI